MTRDRGVGPASGRTLEIGPVTHPPLATHPTQRHEHVRPVGWPRQICTVPTAPPVYSITAPT